MSFCDRRHAAGWMEGGFTNSYEKCVTDVELLQMLAELCTPPETDEDALGYATIAEVPPAAISSRRRTPWRAIAPHSISRNY